jgi:PKD repeat protein
MKAAAAIALVVLVLVSPAAIACPTATPDAGQFHMAPSRACTAAQPCTTNDTLAFSLAKNTACYPSWLPCPGYTIQACDLVTWDFDDGSTTVAVTGQSTITHRFAPGRHQVRATVTNARGTATVLHDLQVGVAPATFIAFEQNAYTFGEEDGVATIRLVRTGNASRRVALTMEVGAGPLVPTRGDIVFAPGEMTKTVALPIVNDTARHGWGPAWVFLYQDGGEAILRDGYVASTLVTIIDDDPQVVVTPVLEKRAYLEGDSSTYVKIGIRLSSPQSEPVRLIAVVWDVKSTARWGSDWRAEHTELEIPPGQTESSYTVELLGDTIAEPQETVVVYLGPSNNGNDLQPAFDGWPLTLTIVDDDSPATPVTAKMNPTRVTMKPKQRAEVFLATRESVQPRTVTFTSSDPSVAYVMMPERTMLAGASALAFTVDAGVPGTATITGRFANGLSASLVVTVQGPPTPPLPDVFFAPGFVDLETGGTKRVTFDAGNVTNAARVVTLTASNRTILTAPATITIPAGASSASFDVVAKAAGYSTLSARMPDGRSTIIAVTITAPLPVFAITKPANVSIGATQSSTLALTPKSSAKVTLKASRAGIVTIPSSVTLGSDGRGTIAIRGVKAGTVDITATTRTKSGQLVTTKTSVTVTKR